MSVSVRRFRVQPASGSTMSCILEGEFPPDALRTEAAHPVAVQVLTGKQLAKVMMTPP